MHSVLEKMLILKSVSIFSQMPDDIATDIAQFVEEGDYKAGETIFQKGDPGTSLYVILSGRVRVHDGEDIP